VCGLAAGGQWRLAAAAGAALPLIPLVTAPLMYGQCLRKQHQQINLQGLHSRMDSNSG